MSKASHIKNLANGVQEQGLCAEYRFSESAQSYQLISSQANTTTMDAPDSGL